MIHKRTLLTACALSFTFSLFSVDHNIHAQAAPPNLRVLDAAEYSRLTGQEDLRGLVLYFNLMRLQPAALEDEGLLNYFIALNNCGNTHLANIMNSEFDYPQAASFYKSRSAEILKGAPNTFIVRKTVSLGKYDPTQGGFPMLTRETGMQPQEEVLDHFDVELNEALLVRTCPEAWHPGGRTNILVAGGPGFRVTFKQLVFKELPMDAVAARAYVESLPDAAVRGADLVFEVEIAQEAPSVQRSNNGHVLFTFAGRVKKVTAVKAGVKGETLAVLSPDGDASSSQSSAGLPSAATTIAPSGTAVPSVAQSKSNHSDSDVSLFQGYKDSCDAGDAKGCKLEGYSYEHGLGVDKNIQMAVQLYEKACSMGLRPACTEASYWQHKLAKGQ